MEMPGTQNIQNNPKNKKKKFEGHTLSDFKNYYKTIVIKTM